MRTLSIAIAMTCTSGLVSLGWGVLVCATLLVAMHMLLRYVCSPKIKARNEREERRQREQSEREWYRLRQQDNLKQYQDEIDGLKSQNAALQTGKAEYEKSKEKADMELLKAKMEAYQELIKHIVK